jgi:hypothetical protein
MRRLRTASLLFIVLFAGCNSDYTIALPNGYFLARVQAGAFGVCRPDKRIVIESKQGIHLAVINTVVAGEIDVNAEPKSPARHFVVDTKENKVWDNLTYQEYLRRLKEIGVSAPPALTTPSRHTNFMTGG